jgi:hypothetical protein
VTKEFKKNWRLPGTNKQFGLNLRKIRDLVDTVAIGDSWYEEFHMAHVHISPVKRVGCPIGANCSIFAKEKANIWHCDQPRAHWPFTQCWPIGDVNWGVTLQAYNTQNHLHGIAAVYAGGVSHNISEPAYTHIDFFCNESMNWGDIAWMFFGDVREDGYHLRAWTREACLRPYTPIIGAIFMSVVIGVFVLYFAVGGFVKLVQGEIGIPNAVFWNEVWSCIITGATYVVRCGKVTVGISYDKI